MIFTLMLPISGDILSCGQKKHTNAAECHWLHVVNISSIGHSMQQPPIVSVVQIA